MPPPPSPKNTEFSIALPPENYPSQEDYSSIVLKGKRILADLDNAFLHGDLDGAGRLSGELFQCGYDLTRLTAVLMIERNNRDKRQARKYQPTQKEIIEAAISRRPFYERITPGLPKEYPLDGDGSGGAEESGG